MRIELKDAEFQKLSEETGVSLFDLQKLYAMGVLRESAVFDILIKNDYTKVRKMGKYRSSHIIARIADKYHVSKDKVRSTIAQSNYRIFYCKECGVRIGRRLYVKNHGLCDDCVVKSIEI